MERRANRERVKEINSLKEDYENAEQERCSLDAESHRKHSDRDPGDASHPDL